MRRILSTRFIHFMLALAFVSLSCAGLSPVEPTATPEPTDTETPVPTPTERPTKTPKPTSTPDVIATARHEHFQALLNEFDEKGYLTTINGTASDMNPFREDWAQINYYRWWMFDDEIGDFVFSSHFSWSAAHATPDLSGCGLVFGLQENGDHYAVFLDKDRILFLMKRGTYAYNVGRTRGVGTFNYGNPAEADFALVVKGQSAYVWVDGITSEYTLSQDQPSVGWFGYTILSGTNKDYGTRCEMTDSILWMPNK